MARSPLARSKRKRSLTCYPLYVLPRPCPVTAEQIAGATALERVKVNLIEDEWGGQTRSFAAIVTKTAPPQVAIHLARLTKDALEQIDIEELKEELLSPGKGKYFSESAQMLIDTKLGLAIGEYRPTAVKILSEWPARMLNKALQESGITENLELYPFPSKEFREVVVGHAIRDYKVELGPLSARALEALGIGGESVIEMIGRDGVLGLRLRVAVEAREVTTDEKAGLLEGIANRLRGANAERFEISTSEAESFDLIRKNLEHYELSFHHDADDGPAAERDSKVREMRQVLGDHKDDLLERVPTSYRRTRKLTEFRDP
jgi:hypothetical protein